MEGARARTRARASEVHGLCQPERRRANDASTALAVRPDLRALILWSYAGMRFATRGDGPPRGERAARRPQEEVIALYSTRRTAQRWRSSCSREPTRDVPSEGAGGVCCRARRWAARCGSSVRASTGPYSFRSVRQIQARRRSARSCRGFLVAPAVARCRDSTRASGRCARGVRLPLADRGDGPLRSSSSGTGARLCRVRITITGEVTHKGQLCNSQARGEATGT